MAGSSIGARGRASVASAVSARTFGTDLVILDLGQGQYFALDEIGACLWHGLAGGRSPEEVALEVVRTHEVELARALHDMIDLANELVDRGLVVVEPSGT